MHAHTNTTQTGIIIMVMMMIIIMIMIIITIIIALKGAIRDFLQTPHCSTNCLQHVRSSGLGAIVCKSHATHQALITCNMLCAMRNERTVQLLRLTECKSHLF